MNTSFSLVTSRFSSVTRDTIAFNEEN